eukprot:gnl/TRDRNA2_/TRDRNA2_165153_c0_seq1.p1 gnl/TRDRNA2_/TRDRNA2_165153_c0~~gnl/TRDRNA2_/TRDRNA2_165153_c0_seq1.p1  ORF type:complete len:190 (-),score=44.02 gnl/TRDRNA2_/TRDRNA2_165153_c0_seq1:22-591(-)
MFLVVAEVWNRFQRRGAHCIEVPHWLPGGMARTLVEATPQQRGNVFFHRTTSVGAAKVFADGSVDVVYIDADHKWWSVLQDIVAWWPKLRPGGALIGHDFHFNSLMEQEDGPGGNTNDVPIAVCSFFRAPVEVTLHSGYAWSVEKPDEDLDSTWRDENLRAKKGRELCNMLREQMQPHWNFEICDDWPQ